MRKLALVVGVLSLSFGLVACLPGDDDGDGKPDEPVGSCADIFVCYEMCRDEAACDACYADAPAGAKADYDGLFACAEANACADDPCLLANCADEVEACK